MRRFPRPWGRGKRGYPRFKILKEINQALPGECGFILAQSPHPVNKAIQILYNFEELFSVFCAQFSFLFMACSYSSAHPMQMPPNPSLCPKAPRARLSRKAVSPLKGSPGCFCHICKKSGNAFG